MLKKTLLAVSLLSSSLLFSEKAAAADQESDALRHFFDEQWAHDLAESPESATLLGDRRHDDRWTDLAPEAISRRKVALDERLRRARAFDSKQLGERDRLSLELFIAMAERDRARARFPTERLALSAIDGPHRELPTFALVPRFVDITQLRAWVARLRAIPKYIDQSIALLEAGRQSGWVASHDSMREVPAGIRAIRSAKPEDSVFYTPFRKATGVPAAELAALSAEAREVITRSVDPAFEHLAVYTESTYLAATRKDVGVWALPDGMAYYETEARAHTTTKRTPEEIHALGLAEVKRIRAEMEQVMRSTGYTGTRTDWNTSLRTDPKFFFRDGAQLLTAYRDIAKRIDGELPKLFGKLPRLPYGVIATPAFEAPTSTTAYYREGSPGDGRAGDFVANTYLPETRPKWEMEALTLHEAVPGHHLQIALAQELTDLPLFRRVGSFTAFIEGWGLYAESLGPALGLLHRSVQQVRPAHVRDVARRAARRRHRHPREEVDATAGHRLLPRQHAQDATRHRGGGRPLHRVAGTGPRVQVGRARDQAPACVCGACARRALRRAALP